jgi:hypothetical protein
MRIGGIASENNTNDILTKTLQPPLYLNYCADLSILQPTLTNNNLLIPNDSHHSSSKPTSNLLRHTPNLPNWFTEMDEATGHKQWYAHMTKMAQMTRFDTATQPLDPYLVNTYTCHNDNTRQRCDTPTPKPCKIEQFLDMLLKRSENVSWAHSGFDRDAIPSTQPRFDHKWRTPILMHPCIVEPRDACHSLDKTSPWVAPLPETRAPSRKNEKTRNTERRKNYPHQSPILFSQKC